MFFIKCDNCGKTELAREYKEATNKQMWCEPKDWLRRFNKEGKVVATFCVYQCENEWVEKQKERKR